jgi:transposase
VAYRKGRATAVSATARKLGVIIWNMITKKVEYKPPTEYLFVDQKIKMKVMERMKKNITKFDFKPEDFCFANA